MSVPQITKVVVNIGVGEGGDRLSNAEKVLELVTGVTPIRTLGKQQNRDLKVRVGFPIGCKATIRNQDQIKKFLKDAFWVRENTIRSWNFDRTGNLSFGIPDYTGYKNENYDPDIGIFGLDIAVAFERPGYRVARRKIKHNKIGKNHRINAEECQEYMTKKFNLEVFKV